MLKREVISACVVKFLVRIDCKSAKHVLEKDVQNIASKQIFARWQAILSVFDFDFEFIEGSQNSIPDFLTREFLQSHSQDIQKTIPAKPPPGSLSGGKCLDLFHRSSPNHYKMRYGTLIQDAALPGIGPSSQ